MKTRIICLLYVLLLITALLASCGKQNESRDDGEFSSDITDNGAMTPKMIFEKCFPAVSTTLGRYTVFETHTENEADDGSAAQISDSKLYLDASNGKAKNECRFEFGGEYFDYTVFSDKDQSVVTIDGIEGGYIIDETTELTDGYITELFAALYALSAHYESGGFDSCISFAENLRINGRDYENSSGIAFKAENITVAEKYTFSAILNAVTENDNAVAYEASVSIIFGDGNHFRKIDASFINTEDSLVINIQVSMTEDRYSEFKMNGNSASGKGEFIFETFDASTQEFDYKIEANTLTLDFYRYSILGQSFDFDQTIILTSNDEGILITETAKDGALTINKSHRISKCGEIEITMPENPIEISEAYDELVGLFREKYPTLSDHMGLSDDLNGDGGADGIIGISDKHGSYILDTAAKNGIYMTSFTIGESCIVLNDEREIPLNYSSFTYNEENGKHTAEINGRNYEISEYTDQDGRLCQSLVCIDEIENLDFTASVIYYPELEYGEISLGFVYESDESGETYTFTFPDGYKETRSVAYDASNDSYVFSDITENE